MKSEISSLELYYLVKELKVLEDSKVDRIFHSKNNSRELVIGFHTTGKGKSFLRIILPSMIFLTDYKEASDTPTGLCMMLRKYLEGSRLRMIRQQGFERIIELSFDAKIEGKLSRYYLIIELFSKGNIILCDDKYTILNLLEVQHWRDREINRNHTYKYPAVSFDILTITSEDFSKILHESDRESTVKTLAIKLSLGGIYAEEICLGSQVDKNKKPKDLNDKEVSAIYRNFKNIFNRDARANLMQGSIFPFELEPSNADKRFYSSFSEAITENYENIRSVESKKSKDKSLDKIRNIIEEQEKLLAEYEQEYITNQSKGEAIYQRYGEINEIINALKNARKKYSWKEIKKMLDNNPKIKELVKDISEKENTVTVHIEDKV